MAIIECKHVNFSYDGNRSILQDVSMSVEKGQLVTLLGPNGVGKSTLLNCITGLLRPQSGSITLDGRDLFRMPRRAVARQIAYVPQKNDVPFDYQVREFVVMGRTAHMGLLSVPTAKDYARVDEALERLGITHLAQRPINELSGGEQQKACIARALVQEPKVVILDEPTAALDYGNQIKVLHLIKELLGLGFSVIQTTHNPDHCLMLGGYVAILDRQGCLQMGPVDAILTEERLSEVYETPLRLVPLEGLGRATCVPAQTI